MLTSAGLSAGLACTSDIFYIGVLWCRGGGRTDTCTVAGGDGVPPAPRPAYVGEEGFARYVVSIRDRCM